MWVPACVSAVLLPIQLPDNAPGEAAEVGPSAWTPLAHVADPVKLGPAFGLA